MTSVPQEDPFFISFNHPIDGMELPLAFNNPFDYEPHPLCILASKQVQAYLESKEWEHNFGLVPGKSGTVIGKMFGVLIVQNSNNDVGFLTAFSGKMGGKNHYPYFVPPVFDGLKEGSFLNTGMQQLTRINEKIHELSKRNSDHHEEIAQLKIHRRDHSNSLQGRIYDHYQFLNSKGEELGLREIFDRTHYKNPPGGAGECAAPKLLQYAFIHQMKPLAIAEFWWGAAKSDHWKHKKFYPSCTHKCAPILDFMLSGLN